MVEVNENCYLYLPTSWHALQYGATKILQNWMKLFFLPLCNKAKSTTICTCTCLSSHKILQLAASSLINIKESSKVYMIYSSFQKQKNVFV